MGKLTIFTLILTTIMRFLSVIKTNGCVSSDCLRYLAYSLGWFSTPELLPLGIFSFGFWTTGLLMILSPLIFSLGLWILLRKHMDEDILLIGITLVNALPAFNLIWMVLLKNGLMVAFLPFFLHFYLERKYLRSLFFLSLMALSHLTFALFAIPVIIHSMYRYKDGDFGTLVFMGFGLLITSIFIPYYLINQSYIVGVQGYTNLNYLFVDIFIVAFAAITKKSLLKYTFLFIAAVSLVSLLFMHEAWRFFIMLNVAALIPAMAMLDNNKPLRKIGYAYCVIALIELTIYLISLKAYLL